MSAEAIGAARIDAAGFVTPAPAAELAVPQRLGKGPDVAVHLEAAADEASVAPWTVDVQAPEVVVDTEHERLPVIAWGLGRIARTGTAVRHAGERVGRLDGVRALAYAIPPAQLLGEDAFFGRMDGALAHGNFMSMGTLVVAGALYAENALLSKLVSKVHAFKDAQSALETETPEPSSKFLRVARNVGSVASAAMKAPFTAIGTGLERAGRFLDERRNPIVRATGRFLYDLGVVNLMGTAPMVLHEVNEGHPTSNARQQRLNSLFVGSWLALVAGAGVEASRALETNVPGARDVLQGLGDVISKGLTPDNIYSASFIAAAGVGFYFKGLKTLRQANTAAANTPEDAQL